MQKWEYMRLTVEYLGFQRINKAWENGVELRDVEGTDVIPLVNHYGAEGWELVNTDGASYVFKRPIS